MTKIRDIEQVVEAAARVFAEKGYEASRLEDIANELGVLQGSLYYHIKSKSDLLSLVQRRRLAQNTDSIEAISRGPGSATQRLRELVTEHLSLIDQYFPESLQWFVEGDPAKSLTEGPAIVEALHQRYYRAWIVVIRQGIECGEFRREMDPHVTTRLVLGTCNWFTRWYAKGGKYTMAELTEMVLDFGFHGIAAPASAAD